MNIKFTPLDKDTPENKKAFTNIGEWFPGEVRTISDEQIAEANILIANGEFVETDEEENSSKVAGQIAKAQAKEAPASAPSGGAASAKKK